MKNHKSDLYFLITPELTNNGICLREETLGEWIDVNV